MGKGSPLEGNQHTTTEPKKRWVAVNYTTQKEWLHVSDEEDERNSDSPGPERHSRVVHHLPKSLPRAIRNLSVDACHNAFENQAEPEAEEVVLRTMLPPGNISAKLDKRTGTFIHVLKGDLAWECGIRHGMKILTVAGAPYSFGRLQSAKYDGPAYEVTLSQANIHAVRVSSAGVAAANGVYHYVPTSTDEIVFKGPTSYSLRYYDNEYGPAWYIEKNRQGIYCIDAEPLPKPSAMALPPSDGWRIDRGKYSAPSQLPPPTVTMILSELEDGAQSSDASDFDDKLYDRKGVGSVPNLPLSGKSSGKGKKGEQSLQQETNRAKVADAGDGKKRGKGKANEGKAREGKGKGKQRTPRHDEKRIAVNYF
jgi:hypothetical protein